MVEIVEQLWAPYHYLDNIPGKGMRVLLIEAFNSILQAPDDKVLQIKDIVQQLHTTSLLLDDVEDNAILRRGRPVAHSIFGVPRTINTASYVMLSCLSKALKYFPSMTDTLFEELLALHHGQGLELYWRDTHTCPTENEYEEMVISKTGGLYRLAVKLLQANSPTSYDLVPLADCLGLIYQIQDDLLNLQSQTYLKNKGFAEDISEGKFSFPVIHCLLHGKRSSSLELSSILMQHTNDLDLKQHALRILREEGSLEYTEKAIAHHYNRALKLINELSLPDPSQLCDIVDRLVHPTLSRV